MSAGADGKGGKSGGDGKYLLSASLLTDGEPVRSICALPPPSPSDPRSFELVSGSQGGILTSTFLPARETSIQPGGDGTRHSHQITALLALPSGAGAGGGGYVTGCKDKLLRVFDDKHRLVRTLEGHDNAVTSLAWMDLSDGGGDGGKGCLVSGSWDGTAKIWNVASGYCMATLEGHENTVSVCALPPKSSRIGRVVTGSAGIARGNVISDHSIRVWDVELVGDGSLANGVLKSTVKNDHTGPIRGLSYDPASGCVVSCSNDGTVKVRDGSTGECVATLAFPGSSRPMLLDVAALGGGVYVAAAEDGNACVWGASTEPQVVPHPGCVWKVLALPDGDFATACHDGYVRIFTRDPNRVASDEEVKQLEGAVMESMAAKSTGPSAEEISKLPKWETNAMHPGRSEGQVQVFNKNGKAIAAQWSQTSQTWIEVGEVTGRNENAGNIDGVSYDHVFPIEIDVAGGGVRKLRIGYNNGENPFVVAQKFIDDYELDQGYLAQIADYIRSRVGEENITLGTGAAPSSATEVHSGATPMDIQTPKRTYQHLPMGGYKSFETGSDPKSFGKILSKLREFNTTIVSTNLPETDLTEVLRGLTDTLSTTNRYHASKIEDEELDVLKRILTNWDCERCFPALDLGRSTVLHPDGGRGDREGYWTEVIQLALNKCKEVTERNVQGTASVAVPMLSLRLFANCFKGGSGSAKAVASQLKSVLGCAESFARSSNKNVRLSVATVALNASSYMTTHPSDRGSSSPEQILSVVGTICGSGLYETEGTVRALVALGTVLLIDDDDEIKKKARSSNVTSMVVRAAERHGDKAKSIADEIRSILE